MNKIIYSAIALFILALGYSASYWMDRPVETDLSHTGDSKNCITCHENSISQEAWKGVPPWHNTEFCNPILNAGNREKHRSEAHKHQKKCMNCHVSNFQVKCANCHTQNEWER